MVSKGSNSSASVISEELKVEESSPAARESRKDIFPSGLALVAVCKLNMGVLQRNCRNVG
jgi:hypothetical protein